jgi:hypothetical protein
LARRQARRPVFTERKNPVNDSVITPKRIPVNDVINSPPPLPAAAVKLYRATASLLCAIDEIKRASSLVSDAVEAVEEAQREEASTLDVSKNADTLGAIVETLDRTIISLALAEIDLDAAAKGEGGLTVPVKNEIAK